VFGYLPVILAPFGTVFGYFWLKKSDNPVCVEVAVRTVTLPGARVCCQPTMLVLIYSDCCWSF